MITISSTNEYQLIHMSVEERNELVEMRIKEANDQLTFFNNRLNKQIASYKADATHDVKMLLAFNELFDRVYSQHLTSSLEEYEDITKVIRDRTLFMDNNFKFKDSNLAGDSTVYLVIEPEVITAEGSTAKISSNKEKIMEALFQFHDLGLNYNLKLYINTDSYDTHRTLVEDIGLSIDIPFEVVSHFEVSAIRDSAEVVATTMQVKTIDDLLKGFLFDTGLYLSKNKKVYFDLVPASRPGYISSTDFLLLARQYLPNLLLDKQEQQVNARRATELWLDRSAKFKHIYEIFEDFFNMPSILTVFGLAKFYGFIGGREISLKGALINEETLEESTLELTFTNVEDLEFINDEDLLFKLLNNNPKNLFTNLIRIQDKIVRVETYERTMILNGRNLQSSAVTTNIRLTEKFGNVVLLGPNHVKNYYNAFLQIAKNAIPFKLPERFDVYLRRIAHKEGYVTENLDTRWFSNQSNNNLSQIITDLDGKISRELLLKNFISPKEGILVKDVSVNTEDIRWISKRS